MPLNEEQAKKVIDLFKDTSVEKRLEAIEKAQDMFKDMFSGDMDLVNYAFSAMILENCYNMVRDELKQGFKLVVPEGALGIEVGKKSKAKTTKKITKENVSADMMEELRAIAFGTKP